MPLSKIEQISRYKYEFPPDVGNRMFYRMEDAGIDYNEPIRTLLTHMNGEKVNEIQAVPVETNVWGSELVRVEFLIRALEAHTPNIRAEYGNRTISNYVCITESDIAFDVEYFQTVLNEKQPEIAYIQHFWGHAEFEPVNIAIFCVSKSAGRGTKLFLSVAKFFYSRRYRRMVPLSVLFQLAPKKFVFLWDEHKGCTLFYRHCKYVHFTRPKLAGIQDALSKVASWV